MSDKSLTKKLPLLGGLLALQVVVAGLLYWQGGSQDAPQNEPLLVFDAGEIDRLEMVSEAASLSMHKAGGRWLLSDGLPVDETKLTDLLKDINGLRSGWPVATSEGAHERFNVGDENFRYRINLFAGERQTAGLIMGSAPGFRQLHVRKPGERDVYTVDLNAYAVEPQVDRWLDTALLRPEGDIESIAFNDFVVRKENDQWSVPGSAAASAEDGLPQTGGGEESQAGAATADSAGEADAATTADATPASDHTGGEAVATDGSSQSAFDAEGLARALAELRVLGLADKQAELDAPEASAAEDEESSQLIRFSVSISSSEGDYMYELLSRDNTYFIRRDDFDATFRVSKSLYDRFDTLRQQATRANS